MTIARAKQLSGNSYQNTIDSGYSDTAGMRQLIAQHTELGSRLLAQAKLQPIIHPGAIVVQGDVNPEKTAAAIMTKLQDVMTIDNARHGTI